MDSAEDGEREQILRVATRLFAALGYDSTSTQQIAEAAGLDVATVSAHFADKRELYLAVMAEAHRILAAVIEPCCDALRAASPEGKAEALYRFIDGYFEVCLEYPEIPSLWMHRWLADASDISDLEAMSALPLTRYAVDAVATVAAPVDADPLFITYTMVWCIHGFSLSGVLDKTGRRRRLDDDAATARFRAHLHQLLARALGLA
ncbi:TetR/AcrR family transcriptional regulator [Nonomuraea zeae]|uniref:TetR/AcrR family transcriptional regulator n=1 Tax=Nonomuraea zeae TaxID=1642303 RepID=A0A5S4GA13_9ACTN|nr:TetR/AcrR family transcriptional regulator [Nonomuraea zeae]TMR29855.1 TetR/AcrR family transcriptional regulator [Nonomuraea zeae]